MAMTGNDTPSIDDNFVAPQCNEAVTILYQDDDILLINKPSGLLSLSGKNPLNWDSVHYRLVHGQVDKTPAFADAKLPHRLDFGTSGLMLVGLNARAAAHLNKQFQQRTIKKRYIALLAGWVRDDSGQISAPIAKDKQLFPRVRLCVSSGKTAISEYKVLQRLSQPQRSLVQFTPLTGRTHQLRIHSLAMQHPILGCDLYHNAHSAQQAERLCLHASELSFQHPTTGKQMTIQCPIEF